MKDNNKIKSTIYLLGDNIDTDQILTAEFMKVNPSTEEGYKELGTLAMCGLPEGYPPFIEILEKQSTKSSLLEKILVVVLQENMLLWPWVLQEYVRLLLKTLLVFFIETASQLAS